VRAARIARRAVLAALGIVLLTAAPAFAAGIHAPIVPGADVLGIGHAVGGVFGGIGHAVLGAFSWTFALATKFILVTLGAIVKLLIPRSWANQGVQIMQWIVEVPNYAGRITSPTGQRVYGFAGINELRDLFTWIGMALLPLTLVYATSRAMIGHGDHVAIPITRVLVLGAVLISYPYWWTQSSALVNQLTHTVLSLPAVTSGLHKLMLYAVNGAALGGWQLIDLGLMAAIAIELLGLIFLKVAIVLLGALLYATGPVTIGLIPTEAGAAITRAWASAAITLLALPIVWAAVFAVGALLINDAGTAGPLLAGQSAIGGLLGGILLAVAGLASLWLCLRAAREAGGLLRVQVGGLLALSHARNSISSQTAVRPNVNAARSLRNFQTLIADNTAAGSEPATGAAAGRTRLGRAAGLAAAVGRRGLIGTAAVTGRAGAAYGAAGTVALIGRVRAGAVAAQMARTGTASWQRQSGSQAHGAPQSGANTFTAAPTNGRHTTNGQRDEAQSAARVPRGNGAAADRPTGPAPNAKPPVKTGPPAPTGASAPTGSNAGSNTPGATQPGLEPPPSPTVRPQRRTPSRNPTRRKR
jgi:hypothetical protein